MSVKAYQGNRGKNTYEVSNFAKGVNHTNAALKNGQVKNLINFDIKSNGSSLRPRQPYLNFGFMLEDETVINFSKETVFFKSKQFPNREYIVDFNGKRKGNVRGYNSPELLSTRKLLVTRLAGEEWEGLYVVDGDTFRYDGITYRLFGVNAPELGTPEGEAAKQALHELLNPRDVQGLKQEIYIIYDGHAASTVDAFGRHLVWVEFAQYFPDETRPPIVSNILIGLLDENHVAWYDLNWTTPHYVNLSSMPDMNGDRPTYSPFEGGITTAYYIDNTQPTRKYGESNVPMIILNPVDNIYLGAVQNDLKIGYQIVPVLTINNIEDTHKDYDIKYRPVVQNTMTNHDGVALLGTISGYSGLVIVDLDVPLKDDQYPDFEAATIKIETYQSDVRKIRFEDLIKHSQNLLDTDPIEYKSYYGQEAIDEGYTYPSLRAILFKDESGQPYTQLRRGKRYYIDPLVALPLLTDDNGYGDEDKYTGYAYRYEIIVHNNSADNEAIIKTEWMYTVDDKGNLPEQSYVKITDDTGKERWDSMPISNRTMLVGRNPGIDLITQLSIGSIHKRPLDPGNNKWAPMVESNPHTSWAYYEKGSYTYFHALNTTTDSKPSTNKLVNALQIPGLEKIKVETGQPIPVPRYAGDVYTTRYKDAAADSIYFNEPINWEYYELVSGAEPFRLHNQLPYFNNSVSGLQVRVFITPTNNGTWTSEDLEEMELNAYVLTSAYMPYESEEVKLPALNNTSTILDSQYITTFGDQLVLYGGSKNSNVIYLSDFNNPKYFPFKYALDQIPEKIIHIHEYQEYLLVFTENNIWAVENKPDITDEGDEIPMYYAKLILQNISIKPYLKNTIKTIGKYVIIVTEDRVALLRPNTYTGIYTDLSYYDLSVNLGSILNAPKEFIHERLKHYNIFKEQIDNVQISVSVYNQDFTIYLSTWLNNTDKPYLLELKYLGTSGAWSFKDTLTTGYPVHYSNDRVYMLNHPSVEHGITLADTSGTLKATYKDFNRLFVDNTVYIFENNQFALKHTHTPIYGLLDFGAMDVTNHLSKRANQIQIELANINLDSLPFALVFKMDGETRQTSQTAQVVVLNNEYTTEYATDYVELTEGYSTTFNNFKLDLSRFLKSERLLTRIGVSGKGRVPSILTSFEITNDFEIFRMLFIYKEQTGK